MSNEVKAAFSVTYQNILIDYLEEAAKFRFELRGRERKVDTLKEAKAAIDKPEPAKKNAKPFARFDVTKAGGYMGAHKRSRTIVTITSIAEDRYHDRSDPSHAWVVSSNGDRTKEGAHGLYLIHADNNARWAEYDAITETIEKLEVERTRVLKTIEAVKLKDYMTEEDVPVR